jgi:nucleotide-binding universal stress UspA family protein
MEPRKVLVVANQTVFGSPLRDAMTSIRSRSPAVFVLLVPATPRPDSLVWEESEVWRETEAYVQKAVAALRASGADVSGRVGAGRPYEAVMDLLREEKFDEVIISTLPSPVSVWLGIDLPNRVRRDSGLPVTHVVFDPSEAADGRTHPGWDRPTG